MRDDQPRAETCAPDRARPSRRGAAISRRPASAIIQIDEPALREGLPLRQRRLAPPTCDWAVDAFRLATAGVADETQIHTHMCYSEFDDILAAIAEMDADVITIETSRSNMELLDDFRTLPTIRTRSGRASTTSIRRACPTVEEMVDLLRAAERPARASSSGSIPTAASRRAAGRKSARRSHTSSKPPDVDAPNPQRPESHPGVHEPQARAGLLHHRRG